MLLSKSGKVLLVKEWFGPGNWSLPGGAQKPHESPATALAREIREELGLQVATLTHRKLGTFTTESGLPFSCFAIFIDDSTIPTLARHEILAAQWYTPRTLPPNCDPAIHHVLVKAKAFSKIWSIAQAPSGHHQYQD